jgi:hypothetical protein
VVAFDARNLLTRSAVPSVAPLKESQGEASPSEFILTDATQVLLNGKPCRYEAVPNDARIVGMEVAADKRTVVKIHFRTGE